MPPALQSVVIALTPANSVGGGSGTPSSGNWLFCLTGWNQTSLPAVTVAASDDIHSFWRPGNENTSVWAVSQSSANTRTSIWYTPNLARVPGDAYIAPTGATVGMTCLVVEVAGLGPWDTVTGINTNYAAGATSLNLALPAPSGSAFTIAAVTGDNPSAGQAFAPASWTTLPTVTATGDAEMTSAWIVTSGSISVNGTATSAEDLSGVVVQVLVTGTNPTTAQGNPSWPLLKTEAAFGGGFQTPPDQLTWQDISGRVWDWDEQTGIQFQLGQIQSTELLMTIDNFDDYVSADNVASPFYSSALNSNPTFNGLGGVGKVTPWTATNSATLASSSAHVYASGAAAISQFSLQVTPDGVHASPGAQSEQVTASAGSAYSASAWFYSVAGYATGAQVSISWYSAPGTLISTTTSSAVAIPAATWTQVTLLNQTAPANTTLARVTVQFSGTPAATAYWVAEAAIASGAAAVKTGQVITGTPVRIRAAIGTIGGVAVNRWYVIARNFQELPQKITEELRRYAPATGTDIWSVMSGTDPSPYQGEVRQDSPYAWWTCADQLLASGVLPASLLNSASGNTNVLNIAVSPSGTANQDVYNTAGTVDLTTAANNPANVIGYVNPPGTYGLPANQGWMYGDSASSFSSLSTGTGNELSQTSGASSVQFAGQGGNTGSHGWFMYCNDSSFPGLSAGITVEGWFNYGFLGGAAGIDYFGSGTYDIAAQPVTALTLWELATGSNPVAVLQLTSSGHLQLITYNGASGTTNSVYTTSDLRANTWFHVAAELTTTTWAVYVNGGATASASGSATGMTSAWSWFICNGDLAGNGGSALGTGLVHGGNMAVSHLAIYPSLLPLYRVQAHFWAAVTAGGVIPAPQSVQVSTTGITNTNPLASTAAVSYTPDGGTNGGAGTNAGYGVTGAGGYSPFAFSAVAAAVVGSYTSGPSAWSATSGVGTVGGGVGVGEMVYAQWAGVAQQFNVYSASQIGTETESAVVVANSESFTGGFGASASVHSPGGVASGSGASPPSSPSAVADDVGQRLERILGYGNITYPGRSIDPAPLAVQAATDIGGQQVSQNLQNIALSDNGLLFIDNLGNVCYYQKSHLASQYASPVWAIGPANTPYWRDFTWVADPQRVWNAITVQQFSPSGASSPFITPSNAAGVQASQMQYGTQPLPVLSYLSSATEIQSQANWLFTNFGQLQDRVENVKIDAASYLGGWQLVLGVNIGDVVTVQNWQAGGGEVTGTFRVTSIKRRFDFGGNQPEASVTLTCDFEPSSYWS